MKIMLANVYIVCEKELVIFAILLALQLSIVCLTGFCPFAFANAFSPP